MITWLALSTALCTITSLAVWSRRPTQARGLAVAALLAIVPLSGALLASERGWAVEVIPLLAELPEGEIVVDGVRMVPGESITVTLFAGGFSRLFELPWDEKVASQLQRMKEGGGEIRGKRADKRTKRTGNPDEDDYPMEFHPAPQPAHPEKQTETSFEYERAPPNE